MPVLPPILLHYYITERCNCRCDFCDIWKIPAHKNDDARLADVLSNLRQARRLGVLFVDFTGGEPLLHENLPGMLQEARRLGFKTSVTTNCLLYEKKAAALRNLIDFLHFSLDGLDAKIHDAMRGQQSFKQVMRSLDVARELGELPDLLFTVSEKNLDQLKPMTAFAQALGLMLVVNPVFAYNTLPKPNVDFLRAIERFKAAPFVYVNTAFHRLRRAGGNNPQAPRCRVMDSTIVISPDNRLLLPCYHFQQKRLPIGDGSSSGLALDGLKTIRRSFVWQYFRKNQGRFDFCRGCRLNCYFDPSFSYQLDMYFWQSALAKVRYWWQKNVRRMMQKKHFDNRPAAEIATGILATIHQN